MKTWWNVYIKEKPSFGFSSINGIVGDFPDYRYNGKTLQDIKPWLLSQNAKVVKIADQILENKSHNINQINH